MNRFEHYFNGRLESNAAASDEEITDLENRLKVKLPTDYKQFLKEINGFEGFLGQSYVCLVGVKDVAEYTELLCARNYPGKICIGTNGGGEVFVIGKDDKNPKYGVVPAIGDDRDYNELGGTMEHFIDRLFKGTFLG